MEILYQYGSYGCERWGLNNQTKMKTEAVETKFPCWAIVTPQKEQQYVDKIKYIQFKQKGFQI